MYRPRPFCMTTSKDSPVLWILLFCFLAIVKNGLLIMFLFGMVYLIAKLNKVGRD